VAITTTARGTGGNNTASTSIVCSPTSTIPVGSAGVLVITADNAGGGGAAQLPTSVIDSVGNTWTRRLNPLYDPGTASSGVETAYYVCEDLTVALISSDNITFSGLNSVTAKAYVFWEITPTEGFKIQYVTGGAGTGAASGSPTVTTSSITSGNVVVGGGGAESANTWTGDSDTTNGTWSAQQATGFGSSTTGMSVTSQTKVVTATATQTYNPTLTSADQILGWIVLTEIARLSYANLESSFRGFFRGMGTT
jgi:hypothetical protein